MNPLDCNELVEIVTAYLDGSLDLETRARFDEHLLECDGCDNYLQQFRVTISTVGRIRESELAPEFRAQLLEAFKDWR
ncbi:MULTISPECIES: zf-HC2 domain-containing protein [Mycobacteriaceae]|uniref:Zinc-finger family protein n=13 Tax=Mycobacteriaceae TaxID=1762 RepID=A0A1V3WKU2_MYCKA|nr:MULTISPECIES: zf-HC2 domain-containing protein [Mycobacteriaceae]ETA92037.1 transmembrane anti-sigma factor [Mycobacterium avium 10-5581]EUA05131.1 zinc-finger family protein [Mycobacterium kansasii 824]EUA14620.1 zinc-finger family protein [Mycobacterium kansasii 732]AMT71023.1 transmembrane anti-sigma factor [Mycobacteroides immunogenum]AMU64428.1 anti-sigma factor [Mycobacteroides abscessus]